MKYMLLFIFLFILLVNCTKKVGTNPTLAFSDKALLDSCKNQQYGYYKNNPTLLLSGTAGPHGAFKLRFNSIALAALSDNGKLPANKNMPEGSFIVKDVYSGTDIGLYAFMYKKSGAWLWGEIKPNGDVLYSVNKNSSVCTGCHSQSGNRDLVVSFNFY